MPIECECHIEHVSLEDLDWKIEDAEHDLQSAKERMLILAAMPHTEEKDAEGNPIDKVESFHFKFNECYENLYEAIVTSHRLECAREHYQFSKFKLKEVDQNA